jgi:hemolysin activation/secretion protein
MPLEPTLAVRVGGQHAWGRFPFHDAAFLGGAATLRGWDEQRFAGRSSLYANGELRLRAGKVFLVVPADVGVIALGDIGRVYADDERSDRWHSSVGGGFWIAPLMRPYTVSVTIARSQERTSVYLRNGFAF